jgi:TDG/mug DNA glycosylase family protein
MPPSPRLTGLPPVVGSDTVVLVLGSFPSRLSLEKGEYFANPRNRFWPLVEALLGIGADLPYRERIRLLSEKGIALWDVTRECEREGSGDAAMKNETVNDIPGFLHDRPSVSLVILNGGTAGRLFHRYFRRRIRSGIMVLALPSTSPANARLTLPRLIEAWGALRKYAGKRKE